MDCKIVPDYYEQFHCIAGNCRHTCCAGWEIDIDEESLNRFRRDRIPEIEEPAEEGELPHFRLKTGNRCPFLREDNLCQMILDHGEDYICDICRDHPRFRNFWTGITEIGLGLSCEEVARLILSQKKPMKLMTIGEAAASLPEDEQYLWDVRDSVLKEAATLEDPLQARLAEYFAYRQIPDALYDDMLEERIAFVWDSVNEITKRWNALENPSFEDYVEVARAYSEWMEYNPERLQKKLEELGTVIRKGRLGQQKL